MRGKPWRSGACFAKKYPAAAKVQTVKAVTSVVSPGVSANLVTAVLIEELEELVRCTRRWAR